MYKRSSNRLFYFSILLPWDIINIILEFYWRIRFIEKWKEYGLYFFQMDHIRVFKEKNFIPAGLSNIILLGSELPVNEGLFGSTLTPINCGIVQCLEYPQINIRIFSKDHLIPLGIHDPVFPLSMYYREILANLTFDNGIPHYGYFQGFWQCYRNYGVKTKVILVYGCYRLIRKHLGSHEYYKCEFVDSGWMEAIKLGSYQIIEEYVCQSFSIEYKSWVTRLKYLRSASSKLGKFVHIICEGQRIYFSVKNKDESLLYIHFNNAGNTCSIGVLCNKLVV